MWIKLKGIYASNVENAKELLTEWNKCFANAGNSNPVIMPGIGISNDCSTGECYLDDHTTNDLNALTTIFSDIHQVQPDWHGVG